VRASGRAVAAIAVALLAAPLTAFAADGGTIWFAGAITAPSLQINASPVVSAMSVGTANAQAARQEAGVALTFNSSPGVVSGADVAVQVVGTAQPRDAVAARFVDSGGRVAAAQDGHYRVGHDGGVLSLSPKRIGSDTPAIVVVSYD
jgi:hypothetical protein